jgi:hypothetical protein
MAGVLDGHVVTGVRIVTAIWLMGIVVRRGPMLGVMLVLVIHDPSSSANDRQGYRGISADQGVAEDAGR